MTTKVKQRLCGGTFFALFLRARKALQGANKYYTGTPEPYSEPIALFALAKVMVPDWSDIFKFAPSTVSGNTSEYKTCKNEGGSIYPFVDSAAKDAFNQRVKENYSSALSEMYEVVNLLIDTGSMHKDARFVKELLVLIEIDDSIDDNQHFYVLENGEFITKSNLSKQSNFCLEAFLLGVWHFAITRSEANSFGKETVGLWCPSTGGGKREYNGTLDSLISKDIAITRCTVPADKVEAEIIEDDEENDIPYEEAPETEKEPVASNLTQQVINNNPTFFNFNVSGNNNSFYSHVDTVNIQNGGKKDE